MERDLPILGSHHQTRAGCAVHLRPGGRSSPAAAAHPPHVHRLEGACDSNTV